MAGTTGLEPAASAVTGQRSNQLNYVPTRQINKMRNRQCLCCFARDLHTVELPLLLKRARFLSEPPQTSAFPLHFCDVQNGPEQRALADRDLSPTWATPPTNFARFSTEIS